MLRSFASALAAGVALPALLAAQTASAKAGVAMDYVPRYDEVMALGPLADNVADVRGLSLVRDAGTFTLEEGKLYLLSAVGGRTVGAAFKGRGTFTLAVPTPVEQGRVERFFSEKQVKLTVKEVVFLFADSTAAELRSKVKFGPGTGANDLKDRVKEALDYLGDEDSKTMHPDLLRVFLNGESNSLFWAHIVRDGGDPVAFTVNPYLTEGTVLYTRARRVGGPRFMETVTQFPTTGYQLVSGALPGERQRDAEVKHYAIELFMPETFSGDVSFSASAKMEIASPTAVGPWVAFGLYYKLKVDSARWEDGSPATVFKGNESGTFWVRLPSLLAADQVRPLRLWYHGNLTDRFADFFFIRSSTSWYPKPLNGRSLATFELTYHVPQQFMLASVGERVDSSLKGRMVTTKWKTLGAIRNASFNIGAFKQYRPPEVTGGSSVTVLWSEDAHRAFKAAGMQEKNIKERVGDDVTGALKFFRHVYGEPPTPTFYATEIPYGHGEAFPGLVHLSFITFMQTSKQGHDEVFRAHEVAHQWWGIGVDYVSYRDRWLSEGLAEFSGLWYMQTKRNDNDKYFSFLRDWRTDIIQRSAKAGPISLGHRVATAADGDDYGTIVYYKGAWVAHMLRGLMIDLKTMNEDRFTAMMRDFYTTYKGKRASTEDFRRTVEAHVNTDMRWFFDQWVNGTAIPSYRVATATESVEGGKVKLTLHVAQDNVPETFKAYVPVALEFGDKKVARVRVLVTGKRSKIELPLLPEAPKKIRFNDLEGVLADVKMVPVID